MHSNLRRKVVRKHCCSQKLIGFMEPQAPRICNLSTILQEIDVQPYRVRNSNADVMALRLMARVESWSYRNSTMLRDVVMRMGFFRAVAAITFAALFSLLALGRVADAKVAVTIDVSRQIMFVSVMGSSYATWKVSTARPGYWTPRGYFRPYLLKRMHYSRKYDNSPMPYSIFFKGGYAIHGTEYVRSLGRPASHGCIRLAPRNAARLYSLVQQYGKQDTLIVITN